MLVGKDVAGGDQDVVCVDALPGVGEPEGVVEGGRGLSVGEAVEVPVRLRLLASALILPFQILHSGGWDGRRWEGAERGGNAHANST